MIHPSAYKIVRLALSLIFALSACSYVKPPAVEVTRIVRQTVVVMQLVTVTPGIIATPLPIATFGVGEDIWHQWLCNLDWGDSNVQNSNAHLAVFVIGLNLEDCGTVDEHLATSLLVMNIGTERVLVEPRYFYILDFSGRKYLPLLGNNGYVPVWLESQKSITLILDYQMFGSTPRYLVYEDSVENSQLWIDLNLALP